MMRKNPLSSSMKEKASRKPSGLAHLMSALHQNAAAVVNSSTQLNGPDQVLPSDSYVTNRRNGCVALRKEEHGLGSEEPISIPTMMRDISEAYPDTPALRVKRRGEWKTWTYEQYYLDVQLVARSFIHLGLHRHHSVAIIGANSPEWVIADLAAIFAGGIAVGLNSDLSSDDIARIALDAKADIIVVESEVYLKRVLLIQHKLPELRAIVQFSGEPSLTDKRRLHRTHKKHILSWAQLLEIGEDLAENRLDERLNRIAINHCCTLVYTSSATSASSNGAAAGDGTQAKGVMLSHDNLTWSSKMALGFIRAPGFNRLPSPGEEVLLSYLPLSCIITQTIDIYYTMSIAGTLCFYEDGFLLFHDADFFFDAVAEVCPSVFFGPTSIYERLYHRFRDIRRHMSGVQRVWLKWSNLTLREKHLAGRIPSSGGAGSGSGGGGSGGGGKLAQWKTSVAKNTMCKRCKEAVGFSPRTVFFSGGEPLSREILKFLAGYDIVVHEGFGHSENCGLLSANIPKRYCKLGTAGKSVPGVRTKVNPSEDSHLAELTQGTTYKAGEINCWGRNLFMGYLNKDIETKDVFNEEHWLKMGDFGHVDDDGFLVVHGKVDNFITLKSKDMIVPQKIEQLVRLELPCIKHAMVVGDEEEYLAVLLTLETQLSPVTKAVTQDLSEEAQRFFRHARFDMRNVSDVLEHMEHGLKHAIQAGIDRANQRCPSTAYMLRDWRILPNQFTYQSGEIDLNGYLRRNYIKSNYSKCISSFHKVCSNETKTEMLQRPNSLLAQLSQIKEEDESKASSRNSLDKFSRDSPAKVILNTAAAAAAAARLSEEEEEDAATSDHSGGGSTHGNDSSNENHQVEVEVTVESPPPDHPPLADGATSSVELKSVRSSGSSSSSEGSSFDEDLISGSGGSESEHDVKEDADADADADAEVTLDTSADTHMENLDEEVEEASSPLPNRPDLVGSTSSCYSTSSSKGSDVQRKISDSLNYSPDGHVVIHVKERITRR